MVPRHSRLTRRPVASHEIGNTGRLAIPGACATPQRGVPALYDRDTLACALGLVGRGAERLWTDASIRKADQSSQPRGSRLHALGEEPEPIARPLLPRPKTGSPPRPQPLGLWVEDEVLKLIGVTCQVIELVSVVLGADILHIFVTTQPPPVVLDGAATCYRLWRYAATIHELFGRTTTCSRHVRFVPLTV